MILAVDIGASKAKFAAFDLTHGAVRLAGVKRYLTKEWSGFGPLLKAHLEAHLASEAGRNESSSLDAIAIGIAGPVSPDSSEVAHLTNLPWVIDPREISALTSCRQVFVINDLVAHAFGAISLQNDGYVTLQHGTKRRGSLAIIAAGSGLGESIMVERSGSFLSLPSEGGHADFSPRNMQESNLLTFLLTRYPDHVSWERVVSGRYGFRNLLDFFLATEPQCVGADLAQDGDGVQEVGPMIVDAANKGNDGAIKILNLFTSLYGAEAGNLALKALPYGGVYVSGGIARRILPWLSSGHFMAAFVAKGRMAPLLREIPVHVVIDPDSAVKGLACYANLQLLEKQAAD